MKELSWVDNDPAVEAVAMAIRQTCCDRLRWGKPWEHLPQRVREDYRNEARAAIEAYRKVIDVEPH
jgi:hypothetical protein